MAAIYKYGIKFSDNSNIPIDTVVDENSNNAVSGKAVANELKLKSNSSHSHTASEIGADIAGSASQALNDAKTYTDTKIDLVNNANSELETRLNQKIEDETTRATNAENLKANIDSPIFTGTPSAPTPTTEDNSNNIATTAFVNNKITSLKGMANGLAELDENGKVLSTQLPSYVDDVVEGYLHEGVFYEESSYATIIPSENGKIYINIDDNKTYRWSGSSYVVISETLALGETSSTAFRGDYGKTAYDHSLSTHARTDATKVEKSNTNGNIKINGTETNIYTHPAGTNPHGTTKSDVGLNNVGNFKAVSTVANQGLSDSEKTNARNNIGAGTSSLTLGETSDTAYRGDRGKTAYDHSQSAHAPSNAQQNVQSDWNATGGDAFIKNKPSTFPPSTHTHNYAGSSSAGGAATSANKLNTNAGSATQPVYFSNGVPVATTYTLGKSVPSNAVFTDTVYTHPTHTQHQSGLYKVSVDNQGHVNGVANVTKEDITNLGIPSNETVADYKEESKSLRSASGTEITITDSGDAPIQELKVFGKSEQRTTTGKNLLSISKQEIVISDIKYVFGKKRVDIEPIPSGSYIFYFESEFTGNILYSLKFFYDDGTILNNTNGTPLSQSHTINLTFEKTVTGIEMHINGSCTVRNISIMKNTVSDNSYEAYTGGIASPNPDYPQEIISVENPTITIVNQNLFDINSCIFGKYVGMSGVVYPDNDCLISDYIKVYPGNYTIKFNNPKTTNDVWMSLAVYNMEKSFVKMIVDSNYIKEDYYKFTIEDVCYVRFSTGYSEIPCSMLEKIQIQRDDYVSYVSHESCDVQLSSFALRSIGDVKDELIIRSDGTGRFIQRIKNITADDVLSIASKVDLGTTYRFNIPVSSYSIGGTKKAYCNILSHLPNYSADSEHFYVDNLLVLFLNKERLTDDTLETLKAYLSSVNFNVIYEMSSPIITELTSQQVQELFGDLRTYKKFTTITNSHNAEMEVHYFTDNGIGEYDKIVDRKIEDGIENKVDKIDGKGLSANDFTNAYKTKLDGLNNTKLYSKTGTNEDGTMTQKAITEAISANSSGGSGEIYVEYLDNQIIVVSGSNNCMTVELSVDSNTLMYDVIITDLRTSAGSIANANNISGHISVQKFESGNKKYLTFKNSYTSNLNIWYKVKFLKQRA